MKQQVHKFIKNNRLYLLCPIIGIIIIGILYKLNNVTPLGTNSLLCVDFFHQYGPMLAELYDRIHAGSNLIYSFNMAMGLPFFRNFLNYLSSPFNIIMFFFSRENLLTSYSFIIGAKVIAAMTTMVYYLSKKFATKKIYLIPIGIIYAFSAYFSAYYWNIMWLDGIVFLPLITLGIENIINKGSWKLYTFTLAIMLVANYFIGYMICLFSCVYFLFYLISKTKFKIKDWKNTLKQIGKKCFTFGLSSLTAGMLVAAFLVPLFFSLKSISATGGEIPSSQYYAFTLKDFLFSHLTGSNVTVFASDTITSPNISCGILGVALLLLFILNLDIPFKKKLCYTAILGFFILAFFWAPLDYILHAFHVPNDLPYRYSFLYIFVFTTIGAYALVNINKIQYILVALGYALLMAVLLVISMENWAGITTNMIYINMILLTLYFLFYSAYHFMDRFYPLIYVALIIVASVDVLIALNYNWDITQVMSVFYEDYDSTEQLLDYVQDYDDTLFYRIENTSMLTLNDPSWYNYYGQTTFSSMAYESMAILQYNLGIPGNQINSYYYVQQTPIYDLMFGIKYFIGYTNDFLRYQELYSLDEAVNEFIYDVGLIFGVQKDIENWNYSDYSPFVVQNDFLYQATGASDTLKPATILGIDEIYKDENVTILKYRIENHHENFYYYSRDYSIDFMLVGTSLYYNNDTYTTYTSYSDELYYDYLESYEERKIINIHTDDDELLLYIAYNNYYDGAFEIYELDGDVFNYAYDRLYNHRFDMTEFKEYYIKGHITLEDDMSVYTSIPYDKGWHVYVDGKEVKTKALADALLIFDCDAGTHEIELKYEIPYLKAGLIISTITLLGLIFRKRIQEFIKKGFSLKKA